MAAPDKSRAPPGRPAAGMHEIDPEGAYVGPAPGSGQSARLSYELPEDLIGHTLNDRYKILKLLGSGGMGTVYLAEHVLINKQVAIKVLSPSHSRKPDEVERFIREAKAASRIRQENVVDITDFGYTSGGLAFLVMEYLEGEDLSTTSHNDGALPWRRAVHITRQICAALAAAHEQGVIHRDMKPENVFRVHRGDDPDFIKVLDFGIAKIIDENYDPEQPSHTSSGLMGTPEYVAPELIRGLKPDTRVDIYAVGVILYRLLTGRVPFMGDSFMATLTQHLMTEVRPPREVTPEAGIPEELEAICLKSLEKERDQRYLNIRDMANALLAVEAAGIEHPPQPPPQRPPQRRLLPVLAALVGLILVAALALWAYGLGREAAPASVAVAAAPAAPMPTVPPVTPAPLTPVQPVPTDMPPGPGQDVAPESAAAPVLADAQPKEPATTAVPVGVDPEPEPEEAPAAPAAPAKTSPKRAQLPDRLTSIELAGKMSKLTPRVRSECAGFAMKKMAVSLKISVAANGKVKSATPTGLQAGALGGCVARVAKTARYPAARHGAEFEYTFRM